MNQQVYRNKYLDLVRGLSFDLFTAKLQNKAFLCVCEEGDCRDLVVWDVRVHRTSDNLCRFFYHFLIACTCIPRREAGDV